MKYKICIATIVAVFLAFTVPTSVFPSSSSGKSKEELQEELNELAQQIEELEKRLDQEGNETTAPADSTNNTADITQDGNQQSEQVSEPDLNNFEFDWPEKGQSGMLIKKYVGKDNKPVLPEEIEYNGSTYPVKSIGQNAFKGSTVSTIVIPEGYEKISNSAFAECTNLRELILPDSIKKIGDRAFYKCSKLREVHLPNKLSHLGAEAFYETKIKEVEIPARLREIGMGVGLNYSGPFTNTSLTKVVIQDGMEIIPSNLFWGVSTLKEVVIPDSVKMLNYNAFYGCTKLREITLPSELVVLREKALGLCGLRKITIPKTLTTTYRLTGEGPFEECSSLTEAILEDGIQYVAPALFKECQQLQYVYMPEGIEAIGNNAFYNCSNLTSIYIPSTCESIAYNAFNYCGGLQTIYYGGDQTSWKGLARQLIGIPYDCTVVYNAKADMVEAPASSEDTNN